MNITGNPLMSLLGAAAPGDIAPMMPGSAAAKTGFGAMVAAQVQGAAQLAQGGEADIPLAKIAGLFQKLDAILKKLLPEAGQEAGAAPTAEEAMASLTKLSDVLAGLNKETKGKLFAQLKANLASNPGTKDITAEAMTPDVLMAALVDIANVVKTDMAAMMKTGGAPVADILAKVVPQIAALANQINPAAVQTPGVPVTDLSPETVLTAGQTIEEMVDADLPKSQLSPKAQGVLTAMMAAAERGNAALVRVETMAGQVFEIPKELIPVVPQEMGASPLAGPDGIQATQPAQAAQSARVAEAQAPRFAAALVNQVRGVDFREGVTRVELTPRGLGNIEVEMKTNSDGSLSVVVRAENAHVLNSLREERSLLAEVIAGAGEGSVEFQEYEKGEQQGGQERGSGFGASSGDAPDQRADAGPAPEAAATIGGGQLDLMT